MTGDHRKPTAFVLDDGEKPKSRHKIEFDIHEPAGELVVLPVVAVRRSRKFRWGCVLVGALASLVTMWAGLAISRLIEDYFARAPALGWIALGLAGVRCFGGTGHPSRARSGRWGGCGASPRNPARRRPRDQHRRPRRKARRVGAALALCRQAGFATGPRRTIEAPTTTTLSTAATGSSWPSASWWRRLTTRRTASSPMPRGASPCSPP